MKPFVVLTAVCALLLMPRFAPAEPPKKESEVDLEIAQIQLRTLTVACLAYKLKFDEYPDKLERLVKPPEGKPFIDSADDLKDPWGKSYQHDAKGKHHKDNLKPDVWTVTPSGKTLGNWPDEKKDKR